MKPTVLLVDDERLFTKSVKQALRHEPYDIVTAGSGSEALKILERQQIDVIVADEHMPGMSGCELLLAVQRDHPDTIRMVLTGHATLEKALTAINRCDVQRFFTKPCVEQELAQAFREAIEQRSAEQDAKHVLQMLESDVDWGDCLVPPGTSKPTT